MDGGAEPAGAHPSPTWCPTAVSAWCTGPRSCSCTAPGRTPSTRRGGRANGCPAADQPAVGAAFYQQAELHRLRGEFAEAEEAYRQASRWGREPQPGLALLRLAQGQVDAAAAAIRRALDETERPAGPVHGCSRRYVEIMLAAGDVPAARAAADELSRIAADLDAPLLRAVAAHATGAVLPRRGRCARRPRRAAPGLDGLAGAGRAVRGRAGRGS